MFSKLKLPSDIRDDKELVTLRLLVLLCDRPVLTQAADLLEISTPTASRFLQHARGWFGDQLFVRSAGRLIPTARMLELKPTIENALAAIDGLFMDMTSFDPETAQAEIVIAANDNAFFTFLLPAIRQMTELAPGLRIRVCERGEDLLEDMRSGRVDFAVSGANVLMSTPYPKEFALQTLLDSEHVYVCRKEHPLALRHAAGETITGRDLDGYKEAVTEMPLENGRGVVPIVERPSCCAIPFFIPGAFLVLETDFIHLMPKETAVRLQKHLPLAILPSPDDVTWRPQLLWHHTKNASPQHV